MLEVREGHHLSGTVNSCMSRALRGVHPLDDTWLNVKGNVQFSGRHSRGEGFFVGMISDDGNLSTIVRK